MVAQEWEKREIEGYYEMVRGFFQRDENVLKLIVVIIAQHRGYTKITELHTSNG